MLFFSELFLLLLAISELTPEEIRLQDRKTAGPYSRNVRF